MSLVFQELRTSSAIGSVALLVDPVRSSLALSPSAGPDAIFIASLIEQPADKPETSR